MGAAFSTDWSKTCSKACLDRLQQNKMYIRRCFIPVDETWINHNKPEHKQQLTKWIEAGQSTLKKTRTVLSAGKVMATVFWDLHRNFVDRFCLSSERKNNQF